MNNYPGLPSEHGLYDPRNEHDACGVGFVVDLQARKSQRIVSDALQVLENLRHRGACGCEVNTGDGAGILVQMPDRFLQQACRAAGFTLPPLGDYGAGIVFLPPEARQREFCRRNLEAVARTEGLEVLGWRPLPTDPTGLGESALKVEPAMEQVFLGRGKQLPAGDAFERKLFLVRKFAWHELRKTDHSGSEYFYVPSLSSRTLIYKGMLTSEQLRTYFKDLSAPDFESALALVHSRFSTNTFPSWPLAQPFRFLAHNGEINTLRGNVNWMRARANASSGALILPTTNCSA